MAIIKETVVGKVEVVGQFKTVHVAMDNLIKENGKVISQIRYRHVLHPDMDISNEPQEIKNICNAAWTQEVKDAWIAFKEEQEAELGV